MQTKSSSIGYIFIVMAAIVVVIAGIKSAAIIIVPFLLSVFTAIVFAPIVSWLTKKRVPLSLSLGLVLLLFVIATAMLIGMIGSSVQDFTSNLPLYEKKLEGRMENLIILLIDLGIEIPKDNFVQIFDPKILMQYAASTLSNAMSMVTNLFVIILTVTFIILEATHFENKLALIDNHKTTEHFHNIVQKIKSYMAIKAVISFITGAIVAGMLIIVGVDYPILWGVVAFVLNFIPNIGSLIAAVPAVLLTLIQLDSISALFVALGYIIINIVIGSIVEPKVMGRGLGLSTLVVFLSLIFWGWLLGPIGMLLSIPLTIMIKIILASQENTKWIAILLDSKGSSI